MIQYNLKCADGHRFDSWFQSAKAYDTLASSGHLSCAICGSAKVEKSIMAPRVATSDTQQTPEAPAAPPTTTTQPSKATAPAKPLSAPASPVEQAIAALRRHVEANSDYVGKNFVSEARAMQAGEAEERPIWGEARGDEAKALIDDGVQVMPLPFLPTRKAN